MKLLLQSFLIGSLALVALFIFAALIVLIAKFYPILGLISLFGFLALSIGFPIMDRFQ